jgi:hypothetical protein
MADESSISLWKLLDRPSLPTWINNKAALLGDAAHPFLPCRSNLSMVFFFSLTPEKIKDKAERRLLKM